MKTNFLIFLFLFISKVYYSQEIESITLKKHKIDWYKGTEIEIANWYLFIENDVCYLANLDLPENEILAWFEKRKNSQNIFKGMLEYQQYNTLILTKDNEPETRLNFYLEFQDKNKIKLTNIDDSKVFHFVKK